MIKLFGLYMHKSKWCGKFLYKWIYDMVKSQILLNWYHKNKRPLPWRQKHPNPYKIWIAEIMLQQTTSVAVIPYYKAFFHQFPTLADLAQANETEVLEAWSGLGYYSRAKNIHKTAQILCKKYKGSFPKTWQELITLPGIGPYTSRAIASFAFGQKVGVLDGNVIRFLSRYHFIKKKWWTSKGRQSLQALADRWVQNNEVANTNQALMEMGATVCLKNPSCHICPLKKTCQAYLHGKVDIVPFSRMRRQSEPWLWQPQFYHQANKVLLVKNQGPFLKQQWIWPGKIQKLQNPPTHYDFKHTITHHNIYVQCDGFQTKPPPTHLPYKWIKPSDVKKHNPTSLINKTLHFLS